MRGTLTPRGAAPSRRAWARRALVGAARQGHPLPFRLGGRACGGNDRGRFQDVASNTHTPCGDPHRRCSWRALLQPRGGAARHDAAPMRTASMANKVADDGGIGHSKRAEHSSPVPTSTCACLAPKPRVSAALHRLERAARACWQRGGTHARGPPDEAALDRAQTRHARAHRCANQLEQHRSAFSSARCMITRCTRDRRYAWLRVDLAHRCRNPRPQPSVYTALLGRYIGVPLGGNLPVWLTSFGTHFWEI